MVESGITVDNAAREPKATGDVGGSQRASFDADLVARGVTDLEIDITSSEDGLAGELGR